MTRYKNSYVDEILNIPKISSEEEQELIIRTQNGEMDAKNKLVKSKMYLILDILDDYITNKNYNDLVKEENLESLISECCIPLMQSVNRYNSSKEVRFDDYAKARIRKYLNRKLNFQRKKANNECKDFMNAYADDPSVDIENNIFLQDVLTNALKKRDAEIICYVYGLYNYPHLDVPTIASKYNLTHQRIYQIIEISLKRIKKYIRLKQEVEISKDEKSSKKKNSLVLKPLSEHLVSAKEEDILYGVKMLSIKNQDYYELLMSVYKNGLDNEGLTIDLEQKHKITTKVFPRIRNLIRIKHNRENYNNGLTDTEPFIFTEEDIVNSILFRELLSECNDLSKQVISLKYFYKHSEEEISNALNIDINTVNNIIMNFLTGYKIKVNECFQENKQIIYNKDFINQKLFKRIVSKMSTEEVYKQVIDMRFNGQSIEKIRDTLGLKEGVVVEFLNNFMELYLAQINSHIDNFIFEQLKFNNKCLKRQSF